MGHDFLKVEALASGMLVFLESAKLRQSDNEVEVGCSMGRLAVLQ